MPECAVIGYALKNRSIDILYARQRPFYEFVGEETAVRIADVRPKSCLRQTACTISCFRANRTHAFEFVESLPVGADELEPLHLRPARRPRFPRWDQELPPVAATHIS